MSGKQIQQPRRAAGVGRRGKPGRVGAIRAGGNKIAMQAARHNVQKAKRLLTTRRQQMQVYIIFVLVYLSLSTHLVMYLYFIITIFNSIRATRK